MSCKIIKERERVTKTEYELCFDISNDGGFGFSCDKDGNVYDSISTEAMENYHWCLEHPEKFIHEPYVKKHSWSYTEPAVAKCSCGEEFLLVDEYMGACECPKCGQWYNLFGQELTNPEYWEENLEEDW